ncbi:MULTISPECIES: N-acetylmuramoyl-L-alanine amidase [unclassified Pseudomonas]|uniref:N-acetylmuramoyl-L-alanine amidase n=1 Tax=unclassified Pseudomonas TaxID=196821 RepID=UPI000BD5A5F1|nr:MULTISPECIES: N-acetylmuramoyl-L-alanine amidase [unclassified Pseudomonas]PVZ16426.1 N-acetylmuramoyl-L-alanine amidase [Pseudomonas sp. URIL14HWK12:I12]PVZ25718.1 N-acetylmuramoyl-L-alanine amidase [Pseudomonas sp. URIL14HWK12:I10]PVZ36758.1 N-acetylmuramoyl-L-alanine amidase [Pseudomonas sp. URIL14HWK12:I11]SNZ12672.1 Negative regulator of beta-lactamase expression [Pseudomonas sp. URIL14HWK12:I9]
MTNNTLTKRKRTSLLVVHCSATRRDQDIGALQITQWHQQRGWATIGYHYVIRRNGTLETGRDEACVGAHVAGHNAESIGICLVGGVDMLGKPENNFTAAQFETLHGLLGELRSRYPATRIVGHRDLSPDRNGDNHVTPNEWLKACPSFDVGAWLMLNPPR